MANHFLGLEVERGNFWAINDHPNSSFEEKMAARDAFYGWNGRSDNPTRPSVDVGNIVKTYDDTLKPQLAILTRSPERTLAGWIEARMRRKRPHVPGDGLTPPRHQRGAGSSWSSSATRPGMSASS